MKKQIMKIKIDFNGPTVTMKGAGQEVCMIPFTGRAEGALFTGIVEPCGVDTQVVNRAGVRHMSARYMLTGTDPDGKMAHIYVENNGWFDNAQIPKPFRTVPTFYTDSERLAPYLHANRFIGEGVQEEDGLWICFYEV